MASARLKRASEADLDELLIDMSPMIDMVFLLLIFFMVNAVIIDYRKDKRVEIPKATVAKAPDRISGRIIINVFDDKTANEEGYRYSNENSEAMTEAEITEAVNKRRIQNEAAGIKPTTLHLRADSKADVIWTKRAVKAAGDAGVVNVIFSSFNVR